MPAAFAAQLELPGAGGIEENHRLDSEAAVLGAAEGENIDARAPGQIGGEQPRPTSALAKRAPSIWTGTRWARASAVRVLS